MARAKSSKPVTSRKPKPRARPASSRKPVSSRKPAPATSRKPVSSHKPVKPVPTVFERAYDAATSGAGSSRLRADLSTLLLQHMGMGHIITHPEPILAALAASNPSGAVGDALRASRHDPRPENFSAHFAAVDPDRKQVAWFGLAMYDLGKVTPNEVPDLLYRWVPEESYAECMAVWAAEAQELYRIFRDKYRILRDKSAPSLLHTPGGSRPSSRKAARSSRAPSSRM